MKISFCIATYMRPERLARVLHAIATQEDASDLEIIVSDNDPGCSGEAVCRQARTGTIQVNYAANETNLGMVGNFNRSLSRATGDYIIFNTDDDLPLPALTKTLRSLQLERPGFGAYYGAAGTFLEDARDAETLSLKTGLTAQLASRPEGEISEYQSDSFIKGFFSSTILPYFLWSTGMVRQDIARKIGGMPDYGSPYFTDFCYMALAGAQHGMVVQNTMLGYQSIHGENFGKGANKSLATGLQAAHAFVAGNLPKDLLTAEVRKKIDAFFGWWTVSQLVWMRKIGRNDPRLSGEITAAVREFKKISFFRPLYPRYLARAYLPAVGRTLQRVRKLCGYA